MTANLDTVTSARPPAGGLQNGMTAILRVSKKGSGRMLDTWGLVSRLDRQHSTERDGLHRFFLPNANEDGEKEITIRLANSDEERDSATMLINRRYAGRGYGGNHAAPVAPNCVTFNASADNSVIGTLSLTVDSPDGLASDRTFKDEIDGFRAIDGVRVCELTKFAFDTSTSSLNLLASLFHVIFIYGTHVYNGTDLFIEVAPRHRRFYEAMLGFKPVGPVKTNHAVGSLSHLMWLKVSDIRHRIREHAGTPGAGQRSLYPFFFSETEEIGIFKRLLAQMPERHREPAMAETPAHAAPAHLPSDLSHRARQAIQRRRGQVPKEILSAPSSYRHAIFEALVSPQTA